MIVSTSATWFGVIKIKKVIVRRNPLISALKTTPWIAIMGEVAITN